MAVKSAPRPPERCIPGRGPIGLPLQLLVRSEQHIVGQQGLGIGHSIEIQRQIPTRTGLQTTSKTHRISPNNSFMPRALIQFIAGIAECRALNPPILRILANSATGQVYKFRLMPSRRQGRHSQVGSELSSVYTGLQMSRIVGARQKMFTPCGETVGKWGWARADPAETRRLREPCPGIFTVSAIRGNACRTSIAPFVQGES